MIEVVYSKITKDKLESYFRCNIEYYKKDSEEVRYDYKREKIAQALFKVTWIVFCITLYHFLSTNFINFSHGNTKSMIDTGEYIAVCILAFCTGKVIAKHISPWITKIEKELDFKSHMEAYYIPLLELQNEIRAGMITDIKVDRIGSALLVRVKENGITAEKNYYFVDGVKYFVKDACIDFSALDRIINLRAKKAGLQSVI